MRRVEDPVVTVVEDSSIADARATHPAFGQIAVTRRSTGGSNFLYGSDHSHTYTYALTIYTSELVRNLSSDRYHSGKQLIEIEMTEDQFNGLSSRVGSAEGTPCTLRWTPATGMLPELPRPGKRVDQFRKEIEQVVAEADEQLAKAMAEIEALPISEKKKKESLRRSLGGVTSRLVGSATFVAGRFEEHVETVTENARIAMAAAAHRYKPSTEAIPSDATGDWDAALPRPSGTRRIGRRS